MKQNNKLFLQLKQNWYAALRDLIAFYAATSGEVSEELSDEQLVEKLEKLSLKMYKQALADCLILSGPSGVGKGTVAGFLEKHGVKRLVRDTTRAKRPTEIEGRDCHFVSAVEFEKKQRAGEYIGAALTYNNWRGLPKDLLLKMKKTGMLFYIEGSARTSRDFLESSDPEVQEVSIINVFLLPPSFEKLFARLIGREREESKGEIERRMNGAIEHLKKAEMKVNERFVVNIFLINHEGCAEITADKIIKLLGKK